MSYADRPVFPFPHGEMQFTGISVQDLARIAALHGLLMGGTDLDPQEAADYASKAASALLAHPPRNSQQVSELLEQMRAAPKAGRSRWRFW